MNAIGYMLNDWTGVNGCNMLHNNDTSLMLIFVEDLGSGFSFILQSTQQIASTFIFFVIKTYRLSALNGGHVGKYI